MDIYRNLINGAKTSDLFNNIDTSSPRRILLHETYNYDHLDEYMQYGISRDYSTIKATGNKFYLEN